MTKKLKLDELKLTSFVTAKKEMSAVRGGETNQRACPTAYACPTEYPVCTHPYYC